MTRRRLPIRLPRLMLGIALFTPATLWAQSSNQKLSEILPNQYLVESPTTKARAIVSVFRTDPDETLDFVEDQAIDQFISAIAMNRLIGSQVSSFPLGSSAGGFTWTFDPEIGTVNRVSQSFGPVFTDRALTTGRRRFNFGINYQRATFDSLEGVNLGNGDITTYTSLAIRTPSRVETPIFEDALDLKLTADTVGLFVNYGVTDRLDVGAAIPILHVKMEASLNTRVAVGPSAFSDVIEGPRVSDSANGIGDIVLRGKYNFFKTAGGGGLAGAVDLRLPTGDEEEFLGVAGSQAKFQLIGSASYGPLSPHANIGFTVSGESTAATDPDTFVLAPPNEFNFAGGVDVAVTERLTLIGDIVSRAVRDTIRLEMAPTHFNASLRQFQFREDGLKTVLGSVGVKFSPIGKALVSFNVLFPLSDAGLSDKLTWLGGAEFSF